MKSKDVDFEKVIDNMSEELLNEYYNEPFFNKVRKWTFIFFTFLFGGLAVLFYFLKFQSADLFMQMCIGAATGCFVVAMQEIAKQEEYRKKQKEKAKLKEMTINILQEHLTKHDKNTGDENEK